MTDYNLPGFIATQITLGQCEVFGQYYVTPTAAGVTPSTSIGAVEKATLTSIRKPLDLRQGTPRMLQHRWSIGDDYTLEFEGYQWNQANMIIGTSSAVTPDGTGLQFGGDTWWVPVQMILKHQFPPTADGVPGQTIYFDLYKLYSQGEFPFVFEPEGHNILNYKFDGAAGAANWCATALTAGQKGWNYRVVAGV